MIDQDGANPWTLRGAKTAYETPWIRVEDLDILDPQGRPAIYGVVRFKKLAVGVLPIDADGSVLLVGQWRVPLGRYSWEMPEGGAEPGEAPERCAARELEEEAGVTAGRLIEACRMDLSNSVTDEQAITYIAIDLDAGECAPDPTEVFAYARVPFLVLVEAIRAGRIRDAMTVATVFAAHYMAMTGALPPPIAAAMLAHPAGPSVGAL